VQHRGHVGIEVGQGEKNQDQDQQDERPTRKSLIHVYRQGRQALAGSQATDSDSDHKKRNRIQQKLGLVVGFHGTENAEAADQ